jgi:ABC-type transport system substrate-binding protein
LDGQGKESSPFSIHFQKRERKSMYNRRRHRFSRRNFLGMGGAAFLLGTAAGCDTLSTEPVQKDGRKGQSGVSGRKGKEAPMLAEQVEAGELPPVEERIPQDPLMIEPYERVGIYGGEWNTALLGPADTSWLDRTVGYENLVRWVPDWTGAAGAEEVIPNIAGDFEFNDEGTEYIFKLRRGMKWSDGEPFTADDVLFAYRDVLLNEELYPAPSTMFIGGDETAKIEKVDNDTIRFTFTVPNSLFLQQMATGTGRPLTALPRHYLEQFHKEFNQDIEQLVEKEGAADWIELFFLRADVWQTPELPTVFPWKMTTTLGEGSRVVAERNPYYWKVDPDGSQLPYIDRVVFDVLNDEEVMLTRTLNGEIDMHVRHFNVPRNKPVLAENRERGNYHFFDAVPAEMNIMTIMLNHTHKDSVKREVFQNKDFRIGLSHAINRQEIIDVVFQNQGEPWQAAPRPESDFYGEEFAKQYTEYDVDLANQFLDEAGYAERNGDGIRLGPNSDPISFTIEFATGYLPEWADALEMIQGYWREVGVDMNIRPEDRSLYEERRVANEHDATIWEGGGGLDAILNPPWYFPYSNRSDYAVPWGDWYASGGEAGQEPPSAPAEQMELYDRLRSAVDAGEQAALMREILEISREEFYVIGINLKPSVYGVVKNNFHNVPESMPYAFLYPTPGPTNPEQYFIEG